MTNSTVYTDKNPRIVPMRFTQETQPYVCWSLSLFEYLFQHFQNKSIVSTPFWHQHICHHSRDCLELSSHTNIEDKANHTFNCSNSRAHPRHCSTGDISPMIPKQKIEVPHLRVCFPPIERQLWSRIQKKNFLKNNEKRNTNTVFVKPTQHKQLPVTLISSTIFLLTTLYFLTHLRKTHNFTHKMVHTPKSKKN